MENQQCYCCVDARVILQDGFMFDSHCVTHNEESLEEALQLLGVHHVLVSVGVHVEGYLQSVHLEVAEQQLRALRAAARSVFCRFSRD